MNKLIIEQFWTAHPAKPRASQVGVKDRGWQLTHICSVFLSLYTQFDKITVGAGAGIGEC